MPSLVTAMKAGLSGLVTKGTVAPLGLRDVFGWVREPYAGAWQRGAQVDPVQDLTAVGAVYAILSLISGDISKLCARPMIEDDNGIKKPAPSNSPYWIPLKEPNDYETKNQFFRRWVLSKLMFGNTYVLLGRDDRRMVNYMHVLDPRRVTPMVTTEGDVYYSLAGSDLAKLNTGSIVPASEIIHDRCPPLWHPLMGVPPLYAAAMSATQARRIQSNSSQFFENMSRPSGMLTAPGKIEDATAARLKKEWEQNYSGHNIGRMAVLGDGLNYEPMTIPAEQAQLIDQLKWTAVDIAGAFLTPAYKINVGQMPTNNNVGALNQQYYDTTLQGHIEDMESLLNKAFGVKSGMCIEFDLDGLLRMDQGATIEMLARGVEKAIISPDEARAKLNLPPVPGGNQVYLQQQNYSLSALARRDAGPDPFGTGSSPPAHAPTQEPADAMDTEDSSDQQDPAEMPDPQDAEKAARQEFFALIKSLETMEACLV